MAYVNVLDWKAEQVADWLRGLEDTVYPYAHFFLNNDVTGQVAEHTILDHKFHYVYFCVGGQAKPTKLA